MAFLEQDNPKLLNDILTRKEFYSLKPNKTEEYLEKKKRLKSIIPSFLLNDIITKGKHLQLHSYQMFVQNYMNPNTPYKRLLIEHSTGAGKCLAKGTKLIMSDGMIKTVEDIRVGDMLMGDDSMPRKVLSLARGEDDMYEIIPTKGEKYTVNKEHILCLKYSPQPKLDGLYNTVLWFDPKKIQVRAQNFANITLAQEFLRKMKDLYDKHKNIVEIAVKDYLKLNTYIQRNLKGYKVGVEFPKKILPISPYIIGFWLGDGISNQSRITNQDAPVLKYLAHKLTKYNCYLQYCTKYDYNIKSTEKINYFWNTIKNLNLNRNKHIPYIYKCNTRKNRLKILAGLIDSDGYYGKNCYEISQKNNQLSEDIVYLARSLGFACYNTKREKSWIYKGIKKTNTYNIISISGAGLEDIPVLCKRKKANVRTQIKDALVTGITVKSIGKGDYYGFTIDGNRRFLLKDFTVTHNTIGALSIALNFIEYYKKEPETEDQIGSVFIIGFSDRVFKNTLLEYPEFGFITTEEIKKLEQLTHLATIGTHMDIKNLHEFKAHIKKRFINREGNGYFRFFGYKAFVNRILSVSPEYINKVNISKLNEGQIYAYIKEGIIKLNETLLAQFKNSLIICDEIDNTYNSLEKNNWGVAIQLVLDHEPAVRAVFMSATPLNNNPAEVVDLMNLLVPPEKKIKRSDIFYPNGELKKEGEKKLSELSRGRVSFLRNINPKFFPEKYMEGRIIKGIPYLKFIRCPMSSFHYKTYQTVFTGTLSQESQYLMDFCLPNPDSKAQIGIYQTNIVKTALQHASQKWKDRHGIDFHNNKIIGNILKRDKLPTISAKYARMLDDILNMVKNQAGKIFIYHNTVHMSGVLFIQEILLRNGFIDEFGNPNNDTLCVICGKPKRDHSKQTLGGDNSFEIVDIKQNEATHNDAYNINLLDGQISSDDEPDNNILIETANTIPEDAISLSDNVYLIQNKSMIQIFNKTLINPIITIHVKDNIYWIPVENMQYFSIVKHVSDEKLSNTNLDQDVINYIKQNIEQKTQNTWIFQLHYLNNELEKTLKEIGLKYKKMTKNYTYLSNIDININNTLLNILNIFNTSKNENTEHDAIDIDTSPSPEVSGGFKYDEFHTYTPARFIIVHSEIDKAQVYHSLEKYNAKNNTFGHKFLILLGSRILKESHDLKAIQNMMIMSRPDNIPMLKQIIGRAIRKNSHVLLPFEQRKVNIRIYTTCLPKREKKGINKGNFKLSYEELKYQKKVYQYQIMQKIEKIFHENAIDSIINRDIIWSKEERKQHGYGKNKEIVNMKNFELLWFEPSAKYRIFKLNELNLSTFNAFYAKNEVNQIILIIKRLFLMVSNIWTYNDLLDAVKYPPFNADFDTSLISEDLLSIALNLLVIPYEKTKESTNLINKTNMFNDQYEKIIIPADTSLTEYVITHVGEYYMLAPLHDNVPSPDMETPYRLMYKETPQTINIEVFFKNHPNFHSYDDQKLKFINKWEHVSFNTIYTSMSEYNVEFHRRFAEECISYVFDMWIAKPNKFKKSPIHDFYFKLLYYYSVKGLILWGNTAKDYIAKKYTDYMVFTKVKLIKKDPTPTHTPKSPKKSIEKGKKTPKGETLEEKQRQLEDEVQKELEQTKYLTFGLSNAFKSSLNNISISEDIESATKLRAPYYQDILEESLKMFKHGVKKTSLKKVPSNVLPLGHFILDIPRIYHGYETKKTNEEKWINHPEYVEFQSEFKENNITIGYEEKLINSIIIKFKLRSPIQQIKKFKDIRMIEKGSLCISKSKTTLMSIIKKLEIPTTGKENSALLCEKIRRNLLYREMKARIAKTNVKWYYFYYEKMLQM